MRGKASLPYQPVRNAPRYVATILNGDRDPNAQLSKDEKEIRLELESLVGDWLEVNADRSRFLESRLKAGKAVMPFMQYTVYVPVAAPADGWGLIFPREGSTQAQGIFLQFILHPEHWQLAGACPKCGKYFLRVTRHRKVYCSRRCLMSAKVIEPAKEARRKERNRKLKLVEEAIVAWRRAKTPVPWKPWTVTYFQEAHQEFITEKFLTRWINKGKLRGPVGTTKREQKTIAV
jgi:hypothetical protein